MKRRRLFDLPPLPRKARRTRKHVVKEILALRPKPDGAYFTLEEVRAMIAKAKENAGK